MNKETKETKETKNTTIKMVFNTIENKIVDKKYNYKKEGIDMTTNTLEEVKIDDVKINKEVLKEDELQEFKALKLK